MSSNQIINGHDVSKLFDLNTSPISFRDDHTEHIPKFGSMIYTVWNTSNQLIYVGVGGVGPKRNPRSRINQHRSGDKFCIYIQDYFVLPELMKNNQYLLKKGLLDKETKKYIHNHLYYRFIIIEDIVRSKLIEIEETIKKGVFGYPPPILNGVPDSW